MAHEITPPKRELPPPEDAVSGPSLVWPLVGWVSAAAVAVIVLVVAVKSDSGSRQLATLFARTGEAPHPTAAAVPPPPSTDAVAAAAARTEALESEVRALLADRDRVAARLAALEHNLSDVTGSIQRRQEETAPEKPAEAPARTAAVPALRDPLAMPAAEVTENAWPAIAAPPSKSASEPAAGPVPPPVPMPPRRIAALPETTAAVAPAPHPAPLPPRAEYGIELANGPSLEALRERWAAVKANYGPLLTGLNPVAVRDRHSGAYRLIVGPMPNLAAAQHVCSRFAAARAPCRAAKFAGEDIVQR